MSKEAQWLSQSSDFPEQQQSQQPGIESVMNPKPIYDNPSYQSSGKLQGKVAIISGGDSGIGRAVSLLFAKEGADIAIIYLSEHQDADETKQKINNTGRRCLLLDGDVGTEEFCQQAIAQTIKQFGKIDIVVNNAGEQHVQPSLADITAEQLQRVFQTNIFSCFFLTKAALPHLAPGSTIINTTSITAYKGHKLLLDYSATKGAIVSFTRSLSQSLLPQGIRVNAVAPGPIWTPLIPASFDKQQVAAFGQNTPMKRAGQPYELAPGYLFLACEDSSYMTGQVLHNNGGTIVNG
jgi:NAD(P)-dependent dehydrogenase (short-subunit alcohol dehydrogenase family)